MHYQVGSRCLCIDINRLIGNFDFYILILFISNNDNLCYLSHAVIKYFLFAIFYNTIYIINDTHDKEQKRPYIIDVSKLTIVVTVIFSILFPTICLFLFYGYEVILLMMIIILLGVCHTYIYKIKSLTVLLLQFFRIFTYIYLCGIDFHFVYTVALFKLFTYRRYYIEYKNYNKIIYYSTCIVLIGLASINFNSSICSLSLSFVIYFYIKAFIDKFSSRIDTKIGIKGIHRWIPIIFQGIFLKIICFGFENLLVYI